MNDSKRYCKKVQKTCQALRARLMKQKTFKIQAYKLSELATIYNVDRQTFKKWLVPHEHKIGKPTGHFYMCAQVSIIVECIGWPAVWLSAA